jgi:hypothetical protein
MLARIETAKKKNEEFEEFMRELKAKSVPE